jgi:hypothetical protein
MHDCGEGSQYRNEIKSEVKQCPALIGEKQLGYAGAKSSLAREAPDDL